VSARGRFATATVAAAVVGTVIGVATRPLLSFDLVAVDPGDGAARWPLAAGIVLVLWLVTAALVALPVAWIVRHLPARLRSRSWLAPSAATAIALGLFVGVVPWTLHGQELLVLAAGAWLSFAVWYALWFRGAARGGS